MEREIISFETAISQIAQQLEYCTAISATFDNPPFVERLPAAIINNSTIIDRVGCDRCRVTTEVEIQLIKNGVSLSYEQKNEVAAAMKCDAMEILSELKSYTNIVDITEVNIEADNSFMAESDDVAIRVAATVVSNYTTYSQQIQVI